MNKQQVTGRVDKASGKLKEVAGRTVGNERLESEGLSEQATGEVKAGYGDAKESFKDKAKDLINKI